MNRRVPSKVVFLALFAAALLLLCSCSQLQSAMEEVAKRSAEPEATEAAIATATAEPAAATPTATSVAEAEEDAPEAIFENEYVRIYFTGYSAGEGTLSFRVENLTQNLIYILMPVDQSGDLKDAEGSLMVDGEPHMAVPNSGQTANAASFCLYKLTTATGPDSEGYLSLEPLSESAKTAQLIRDLYICDENKEVLSTVILPAIDLTAAVYFPLPNAMNFTAKTLSGEDIDGSYFSGHKLTMINFWATWCGPCVSEMPDIAALHTEYADKGFAVLGVLVWDEGSEKSALDFLTSSGITYPVVAYDTVPAFMEIANTQSAIPFTIFYDEEGNQVGDVMVGSRSKAEWAGVIDELLLQVG